MRKNIWLTDEENKSAEELDKTTERRSTLSKDLGMIVRDTFTCPHALVLLIENVVREELDRRDRRERRGDK